MKSDNIVNISMFGGRGIFGGRETKKEVVISSCAFADTCEALKNGRCSANNPRTQSCINMETRTVIGYTSRAMKHNEFVSKWRSHEKYGSIEGKLGKFEYIGDNKVRIQLPYIDVSKAIYGSKGHSAISAGKPYYMDKADFTLDVLENIMESYSNALMGGSLKDDSEKPKEEMLLSIKEIDIELYNEYIVATGYEINYIDKEAYLVTLKPDIELTEGWYWDGKYLSKEAKGKVECNLISGFNVYGSDVRFKPEQDSTLVIKDVKWVTDETKFKN